MRVGFLTSDLHHGHGWGHYGLSLILALRRLGVEPVVWASRNSPTDYDFELFPVLPNIAPAEPRQLMTLAGLGVTLREAMRGCDLLHCTLEPYAPLAMWGPVPYVITGHGSYAQAGIDRHPLVRRVHQAAFRRAKRVICVSRYTEKRAREYTPGIHTSVINNGVDLARFAHLPPLPEPVTRPTILTTGGVKLRKGTLELVHAVAQVREQIPDVQCMIIGSTDTEPDTTAQVKAAITELDLQHHVFLLGFVPQETLLGWYGAADVFALPSMNSGWKFEGYGLVHLEASAAGLPVIGTRDCGAEDAIEDGGTGYLVRQGNIAEDLPAALLRLLTDGEQAKRMGAAGKAYVQHFTWDHAARQMLAVYKTIPRA